MCNIAHVKVTKSSIFLLKTNILKICEVLIIPTNIKKTNIK